ncbi:MAG: S9 family peptidase [Caulobacteraceae bacterium]
MASPAPPRPRKESKRIVQLGRERVDEYAWMKDDNWRAVLRDPSCVKAEVRAHLEAENAYADAILRSTGALREALFAEMKGRMKPDEASAPVPDGPFEYFIRYEPGAEHPRHLRRRRGGGGEEVLLDEQGQAAGKAYYAVAEAEHSPDHALFAWAADERGSEYHRLLVRDLTTGTLLGEPIEDAYGAFAFSPDGAWLFWIWRDASARPAKVFRRPARGGADALVYEENDEGMFLAVGPSADRAYMLISAQNQEVSETWIIDAADPAADPVLAEGRRAGVRYELDHWSDRWIIRTNEAGAVDFKLMVSRARVPAAATWRDWIGHEGGRLIAAVAAFSDHLVRLERKDAADRLVVTERTGGEHEIAFDEPVCALSLAVGYEYATASMRFVYQSPTTPRRWIDYDMASRERRLVKTQEIPSGHDPAAYESRRLWARAADGAEVPITLLMRAGTPADGAAPVMLHGYGAYGIAMEAAFSSQALSLVDRGWIWAIAHVRGGSDKGWGWFLDGRAEKKTNTFSDFIVCAERLIEAGWAKSGRIVAYGGSAGGMLVGAVINQAPELFGGAIAVVPFVDVLNTMSDTSLPLTPPEWPEWGNPLEDARAYDRIAAYSPYDNVAAMPYPAVFARAGLSDPRVTWWEPEKWVARLREATTSGRPILLKTNLEAGHGGASGRYDHLGDVALDYAFAIWALEAQGKP